MSQKHLHSFFNFFFNDAATTEIYTLSLHDALPISGSGSWRSSLPRRFSAYERIASVTSTPRPFTRSCTVQIYRTTRAKVTISTRRAPAFRSADAAALAVAPIVVAWTKGAMGGGTGALRAKGPATLRRRSARERPRCR